MPLKASIRSSRDAPRACSARPPLLTSVTESLDFLKISAAMPVRKSSGSIPPKAAALETEANAATVLRRKGFSSFENVGESFTR